jgi:hypothetical protein
MTHDERATLIKRIFMLLLFAAVVAGVWFYPKPAAKVAEEKAVTASPENGLLIVLHDLPGDPASEQMAEILKRVQTKYGKQVIVSVVDFKRHPEASKAQGVTKPPHVVIISGTEKVFDFQGVWTQAKVEYKVDEILRGLKRVGKDWRPPVPGMTPAGG